MSETTGTGINPQESQERLSSPNKIFFHTTPTKNVPSLIQNGLVSIQNKDVIGKDLLYSVAFGKEFSLPYIKREIKSRGDVTDFSLTLWADTADIKQVKKDGQLEKGQYGPTQKLLLDEEIPEGFLESRSGGRSVDVNALRKVGPNSFLAAIPINQDLRYILALCKLEVTKKSRRISDMEGILVDFFRHGNDVTLKSGYTLENLSCDLIFRMQQEALLYQTGPLVKEVLDNLKQPLINNSLLKATIAELKAKQGSVNDPIGNRYLGILERKLRRGLNQRGLGNEYDQIEPAKVTSIPVSSTSVDPYQLWGGMDGRDLVKQVAQDLQIKV